ncbi:YqaJ viral recombinase family protein [Rhizobium sp. 1AS11]|uniref:YqaJ viral recombinase family nuclease n=1 Tax=Rhizobium acaciae TaxID=2989736 RepID=UPI0022219E40|nr:YqaJ viral recombinase family protein [Rhizobium acaciae]MCW1412163.1 YqaJ viral recombinase family protein [Rhizobium acaciae]MCW1744178.1 YqaJ viral recombinase family protein [Rhizobium acaciae]
MKREQYTEDATWFWPRTEAGWHKLRKPDITATAAATLFGVSPYMTPFDMFHRMRGTVEVVFEENERMTWGKRLQNAIAEGVCCDNGWEIVDRHPFLYARSNRFPGCGASPDYVIRDPARPELGLGGLEIKNVDFFVAKDDWTDEEAPPHIEFQAQHQMMVTGLRWNVIAGLVGGNTVKKFVREYDAEVIAELAIRCSDMHQRVRENMPPAADYLADYETIRTLYRNATPAKSYDLDIPDPDSDLDPEKLKELIEAKYDADIAAKLAKEDAQRASAELLDFIKDTETVFGAGWKVTATTTHRDGYTSVVKPTSFRNLKVSKPKAKGSK